MKIIYTNQDGGVSVVHAAPIKDIENTLKSTPLVLLEKAVADNRLPQSVVDGLKSELDFELSYDDYLSIVTLQSIPEYAKDWTVLPDDYELPDREFRDAWVKSDDKIEHDFSKAKNIQLERVRHSRDALLNKYDALQLRALDLEDATEQARIKNVKQQLRDATVALKALANGSVDDIKEATPDLSVYEETLQAAAI